MVCRVEAPTSGSNALLVPDRWHVMIRLGTRVVDPQTPCIFQVRAQTGSKCTEFMHFFRERRKLVKTTTHKKHTPTSMSL